VSSDATSATLVTASAPSTDRSTSKDYAILATVVLRVLWVSKGLGPGGAERLLVEAATSIDRNRYDVQMAYVLPWKDHLAGDLETAGVAATCLSTLHQDPRWPWRLRNAMDGVDVVHLHSPVPAVVARVASLTLPRSRRPALVTTEHNTWASHHRLTRWANRLTSGLDAATFAVTREAAESLRGAAGRRAIVVTHGVDVDAIAGRTTKRSAIRASLGIDDAAVLIGTVANFRAQKDYPNLLRAARQMIDAGVDVKIIAVGQGPDEAAITELHQQLNLEDHVILAGFRPDAVDVMGACDIFTLASAWEGLPVAVMEALALGLPIVATRVGGLAESLDETSSVLVAPGDSSALADALTTLVVDPERQAELARGARIAADQFDSSHAMTTITGHYDDLAGPARTQPAPPPPPIKQRTSSVARAPIDVRPMTGGDTTAVIDLLGAALGRSDDKRYNELFAWKHRSNPFGMSPGWVAVDSGDIVGVRLFMRWRFRRGNQTLSAVRAVDTATHPDHQGRGLFTRLTNEALAACLTDGIDFVFNTPNAQSRPGYLKMGWRDVGRPRVAIRPTSIGSLASIIKSRVPADRWSLPIDIGDDIETWLCHADPARRSTPDVSSTDRNLRTDVDDTFLAWRYGLSSLHYRVIDDGSTAIIVRLRRRGSGSELVIADSFGNAQLADRLAAQTANDVGATHALRLGAPNLRGRFTPMPGIGPDLTWRALNDAGQPPLPNWDLRMGDIELF
jgi:glycosyltransferase involved in cell wall biosynthesis/GNAT superfamily N-acetyltransferase